MLVTYLEASRDLCETDSILFGATLAVCRIIGAKLPMAERATRQSSAIPAWKKRIEDRIAKARAFIGRLTSFRSGNNRPRVVRTFRMAFAGTNISLSQPDITQKLTERIDDLKQKIAAWGKRIRRFSARSRRFNQNRLFQSDQKRLYKSLEQLELCGAGPGPDQADTVAFWRGLWSEPINHNEGPWMEVVASQSASVTPIDPITITPEDVAEAIRRAPNWKSPGLDRLHHYWLKGFVVCHAVLARQFQQVLNQKSLPSLFTTGITHLVPKDQDTTDPSKYQYYKRLPKDAILLLRLLTFLLIIKRTYKTLQTLIHLLHQPKKSPMKVAKVAEPDHVVITVTADIHENYQNNLEYLPIPKNSDEIVNSNKENMDFNRIQIEDQEPLSLNDISLDLDINLNNGAEENVMDEPVPKKQKINILDIKNISTENVFTASKTEKLLLLESTVRIGEELAER
ncbi:unnamed protein product [Parnassius apollo]|uniref:(apollo) hypothetical protein n=1 Tax=Parnassius apollo TaxID=110799 RepID=A0A8S3WA24_PARAO|nr:unnamed protein product [Parnassius apollo]